MATPNIASIAQHRGLSDPVSGLEAIIVLQQSQRWTAPSPYAVFGEQDSNYSQVVAAFRSSRKCISTAVYVATIKNCLVSPKGLVFTETGQLIYETVFPWQLENLTDQFSSDLGHLDAHLPASDQVDNLDIAIHCREGGEVGYFHFINSILPRISVSRRLHFLTPVPILVNKSKSFAKELLEKLNVKSDDGTYSWKRVKKLYLISPFTFQGDHFTRPPFGSSLLKELFAEILVDAKPKRKIYLDRGDVTVRRIVNEEEILRSLEKEGFERITIGDMSMEQQINLFKETKYLVSPHGAGLSNLIFMPSSSKVLEIVSPERLWPTFRMLAARHNIDYGAIIGSYAVSEDTARKGQGNEDFFCQLPMVMAGIKEMFASDI